MKNDPHSPLWVANSDWATHAGEHLPWLRPDSQHVHIVGSGLEEELRQALVPARYELVTLPQDIATRESLMATSKEALRLWDYCWAGWDSWSDCLSDLNDIWPDCDRLALLWPRSDLLFNADLPSWLVAIEILRETSAFLQTEPVLEQGQRLSPNYRPHRLMVFETFCFVTDHAAQRPEAKTGGNEPSRAGILASVGDRRQHLDPAGQRDSESSSGRKPIGVEPIQRPYHCLHDGYLPHT
jgi:hypothetical protein